VRQADTGIGAVAYVHAVGPVRAVAFQLVQLKVQSYSPGGINVPPSNACFVGPTGVYPQTTFRSSAIFGQPTSGGRAWVVQLHSPVGANMHRQLIRGSLGALKYLLQTVSRSVQWVFSRRRPSAILDFFKYNILAVTCLRTASSCQISRRFVTLQRYGNLTVFRKWRP